jgi:hypothetical protein
VNGWIEKGIQSYACYLDKSTKNPFEHLYPRRPLDTSRSFLCLESPAALHATSLKTDKLSRVSSAGSHPGRLGTNCFLNQANIYHSRHAVVDFVAHQGSTRLWHCEHFTMLAKRCCAQSKAKGSIDCLSPLPFPPVYRLVVSERRTPSCSAMSSGALPGSTPGWTDIPE